MVQYEKLTGWFLNKFKFSKRTGRTYKCYIDQIEQVQKFEYRIFADYYQFYLQDELSQGDLSENWTEETVERMLALGSGVVGIGTLRNSIVPVTVELHDLEPVKEYEQWDQVAECTIEVPSGNIVIARCSDYFPDAARIEVSPGTYRARILYGSLSPRSNSTDGEEFIYVIQLWAGSAIDANIHKRRAT